MMAAWLRLQGLDWDEGQHLHPDERFLTMVETAISLPSSVAEYLDTATSPLNPANRGHTFFVYGTFPIFLVRVIAEALGQSDYAHVHLVGRVVSVLFQLVTIWITLRIGVLVAGPVAGLAACTLFTFGVLPIQQAHFFSVDSAAAFWATAALLAVLHVARGATLRWHMAAGIAFGLMLACRINLLLLVPIYPLAAIVAWRTGRVSLPTTAAGVFTASLLAAAIFRLAQPYAFVGPGFFDLAPAPAFVESMEKIRATLAGAGDYPPLVQWIGRTPVLFAAKNVFGWGLGPAWGLAALWGIGWSLFSRRATAPTRLTALWIGGPFLFFAAQFASTGRYYLPLVPALAIVAAASLARRRRVLTAVILLTAVWALAFSAIYRRPHTRVEASRWLHAHVPAGAMIASEHWDDALPLSVDGRARDRYRSLELTLYDEENEDKRRRLVDALEAADWIVISSNRLYRSIPRAPWRYPLARRYYELLFGGQLGFRLEQVFTSYPRLGPLEIPDDDAEEQFTVLDHPKVLVFRKTDDFARARVEALFDAVSLANLVRVPPAEASALYWRMRPAEVPLPGAAGLRTAVAPRPMSSLGALVRWLATLEALALALFVLVVRVLGAMPDGGFGLAKLLGWVAPGYAFWLLASLGIVPYTAASARTFTAAILVVASGVAWKRRAELRSLLQSRARAVLSIEAAFLCGFGLFSLARAWNPAIASGEKPMEFAIFNALLRAHTLPPADPWFAGAALNYSYFGHALVAFVAKVADVPPALAFNLAIGTVAAILTVAAHLVGRQLGNGIRGAIVAVLGVVVIGNLAGPRLLWSDPTRKLDFDYYWATSRVIERTINEFPAWNLLFADVHAHVLAQPLEVALVYVGTVWLTTPLDRAARLLLGLVSALLVGAVATTSTWSAPTMAALLVALVAVQWRRGEIGIVGALAVCGGVLALAGVLFAPFWMHYKSPAGAWGWELSAHAPVADVLTVFGVFLVAIVAPLLARFGAVRSPGAGVACVVTALASVTVALVRSPTAGLFTALATIGAFGWWSERDVRLQAAAALLAVVGSIGVATESVYVWDRMNTIFKYYLDMWLVLGCVAAATVAWASRAEGRWRPTWIFVVSVAAAGGLFTSGTGAYGLLRAPRVASDRPTLNGMRYLARDAPGELAAFQWLNREVPGVPVVLEAQGPFYQRFGRVSMNTGLPTVLGWEYHLYQQGHGWPEITERRDEVRAMFSTTDAARAATLMDKYHVDLVFVGPLERQTYAAAGLAKFENGSLTEPVFRNAEVTIYARPGALSTAKTWIEDVRTSAGTPGAPPPLGVFAQPRDIARAPDGTFVVADFGNRRIQRVGIDGGAIAAAGREGDGPGEYRDPCGIAVAPDGAIYVADTWNHRVQKLNADGEPVLTWSAGFYGPRGIAVGADGSVFVADTGNGRVQRFASDGTPITEWGSGMLRHPIGIALGGAREVYVADTDNRRVVVFSEDGDVLRTWPIDGWSEGALREPYLDVGPDGVVWVTDPSNNRVLRFTADGAPLGTADARSTLDTPLGIAVLDAEHAMVTTRTGTLVMVYAGARAGDVGP